MAAAVESAVAGASNDLGFVRLEAEAFASAPQKSIDYAVMEKTDRAAVVAGNFRAYPATTAARSVFSISA